LGGQILGPPDFYFFFFWEDFGPEFFEIDECAMSCLQQKNPIDSPTRRVCAEALRLTAWFRIAHACTSEARIVYSVLMNVIVGI